MMISRNNRSYRVPGCTHPNYTIKYMNNLLQNRQIEEFNKLYGEIISTKEFIDVLEGNYPTANDEHSPQYYPRLQEGFKRSVSSYEKEIAIFDSLRIISERLDRIEKAIGL